MRAFTMTACGAVLVCVAAGCRMERYDPGVVSLDATTHSDAATSVATAPMLAVSPDGESALAWVSAPDSGTDGRLYISVGNRAPAEIRDSLGPIQAHGEAPPKIAYDARGVLYAAYTVGKVVPGARFPLSALRLIRSRDNGRTWSAPVTVTDDAVFGSHSFHALHIADDGTVYVSWLGHAAAMNAPRKSPSKAPNAMSGMDAMGGMDAMHGEMHHEQSAAWIARSTDGGATFSPAIRVDMGEACPCCRTAIASASDGTLYMAWRHVFPSNIRDIVVARSTDHGATWGQPERVHADDWQFDACPHAGPSIAVDSAGAVHVAWWTGKEGQAGVYYAKAPRGSLQFGQPVSLGVATYSRPAHVQLGLTPDGDVVVSWDDGTRQVPQVVVRASDDGGHTWGPLTAVSEPGVVATFPALAMTGRRFSIAWSQESQGEAAARARSAPDMKNPKATMGLEAVGAAKVFVRQGVLQ